MSWTLEYERRHYVTERTTLTYTTPHPVSPVRPPEVATITHRSSIEAIPLGPVVDDAEVVQS